MVSTGEFAGAGASSVKSVFAGKAIVKAELLSEVAGKDEYRVNNKHDNKYPPLPSNKIVQLAMQKVGREVHYSLTHNNCEHFVNKLRYGISRSDQVFVYWGTPDPGVKPFLRTGAGYLLCLC